MLNSKNGEPLLLITIIACRLNAIRLEEKEAREKEMRNQIIIEAEEFKVGFYEKRKLNVETNQTTNREKEKVQYSSHYLTLIELILR